MVYPRDKLAHPVVFGGMHAPQFICQEFNIPFVLLEEYRQTSMAVTDQNTQLWGTGFRACLPTFYFNIPYEDGRI